MSSHRTAAMAFHNIKSWGKSIHLLSSIPISITRGGSVVGCRKRSTVDSNLSLDDIRNQLLTFKGGSVELDLGRKDSVAVLSVSNPQKRNAFTGSMCVSLHDAINELEEWKEGRAVIIRGMQGMFCAGADLTMAKQIADSTNGERFSYFMQNTLASLKRLNIPSFALMQGNVLGGGAELMAACDYVIAEPNTQISFVQGRMGIVPGWAGATHLCMKVGYQKALDLLITSKVMDSLNANEIGLIDHILESDDAPLTDEHLLEKGLIFVNQIIKNLPSEVIHGLKQVTLGASMLHYSDSLTNERNVFKTLWGGEANMHAFNNNLKHIKKDN